MHGAMMASLATVAPLALAQSGSLEIESRVSSIEQANRGSVELSWIGASTQGRNIPLLTIRGDGEVDADSRSAVLLVAGVQGDHEVGVEAALGVAERMAASAGTDLTEHTLYVVPCLNRDGLAFHLNAGRGVDFGRAPYGMDADRDGRVSEDPGEDLDGDGLVTLMRVFDQGPGSEIVPTHLPDAGDARLNATPDNAKGEVAEFAVFIEGVDNDGDGRFNEDGPGGSAGGGIDLDRHFPAQWPEHEDGAGPYALRDPQARALAEWLVGRTNVSAVVVFGPHDTLASVPPTGKHGPRGSVPVGIEEDDEPYHKAVSESFKEITAMTGAPSRDTSGSLASWAYSHMGTFSFSTPVWVRPDLLKTEEEADGDAPEDAGGSGGDGEQEEQPPERIEVGTMTVELTPSGVRSAMSRMEGMTEAEQLAMREAFQALAPAARNRMMSMMQAAGEGGDDEVAGSSAAESKGAGASGDDAKWLTYSDEQRGGEGFVAWRSFEHPQLGRVEIGGFVPGFRVNPPESEHGRLIDEQTRFVQDVVGRLPTLDVVDARAVTEGPGLWRVSVRLRNEGFFPTRSAIGVKARRLPPTVVVLNVDDKAILAGSKVQRFDAIEGSGGTVDASWLTAVSGAASVPVEIRSPVFGTRRIDVTLGEGGR